MQTNTFLVCNAHLDIVWLWSWDEGATEALSTFRTAVRFCKEYDGFIFNHNEAVLYEWIEEYDPALFRDIQELVKQGKWHIMGGWYLQPDCNMPSGESFVRQILKGRMYFRDRFGANPTTAINFDPFGHTRGLVQIMKKSGYDSYIVCRPGQNEFELKDNDFIWVGFDGSEVMVHRILNGYSSGKGRIEERINKYLENNPGVENGLLLWGVGNHGGGPSKEDLDTIERMMAEGTALKHTTPEDYFKAVKDSGKHLEKVEKSMQHTMAGCYTSAIKIKEYHRRLESEYFLVEKMASHAAALDLIDYPKEELSKALKDLLTLQFHDTLPGSSIKRVEQDAVRLANHGLEILSKLKFKIFAAMIQGKPHMADEEGNYRTPIYIYNPHPFAVEDIFEYELALSETIREGFGRCVLEKGRDSVDTQTERVENNVPIQWRKRMAFRTKLEPYSMQKLDFHTVVEEAAPERRSIDFTENTITFENEEMKFVINRLTGLVDAYQVNGQDYLKPGSFAPMVFEDEHNSWGMWKDKYNVPAGTFHIRRDGKGIPEVRIIEDGPVRTVVECVFEYNHSNVITRYKVPKKGTEVEIEVLLRFAESLKIVKLGVHTLYEEGTYLGDAAFGVEVLTQDEQEVVAQKWTGVTDGASMLTLINDSVYGSSFNKGSFYPTLIKSCGFSAHPMANRVHMPDDRYIECSDFMTKTYKFYLNAGIKEERLSNVNNEALVKHERPYILNGFTDMETKAGKPFMELNDSRIVCSAVKYAEDGAGLIVRLFNTMQEKVSAELLMEAYNTKLDVDFNPYEVRSYKYEFDSQQWTEVDLLEDKLN